jgi:hypothetical protein
MSRPGGQKRRRGTRRHGPGPPHRCPGGAIGLMKGHDGGTVRGRTSAEGDGAAGDAGMRAGAGAIRSPAAARLAGARDVAEGRPAADIGSGRGAWVTGALGTLPARGGAAASAG